MVIKPADRGAEDEYMKAFNVALKKEEPGNDKRSSSWNDQGAGY